MCASLQITPVIANYMRHCEATQKSSLFRKISFAEAISLYVHEIASATRSFIKNQDTSRASQ
jgi:hypothetical protein